MSKSFVIKGNICQTKNPRELVRIVLSGRDTPHDDDLPLDGETEENGDAG